jgi:hypothetical protein
MKFMQILNVHQTCCDHIWGNLGYTESQQCSKAVWYLQCSIDFAFTGHTSRKQEKI